tara:strand:- start:689 stop:802 length:114 start_codon:yes stop_codon:yes gene_type:complete
MKNGYQNQPNKDDFYNGPSDDELQQIEDELLDILDCK